MKGAQAVCMVEKLIIINGSDIEHLVSTNPEMFTEEGFYFCPVDRQAILFCLRNNYPYVCMDEWVKSEDIVRILDEALSLEKTWFISEKDAFTVNGICWPEFDRHAMDYFWNEVALCKKLAEIFVDKGLRDLVVFRDVGRKASVYDSPADIYPVLFQLLLRGKVNVTCISKNRPAGKLTDRLRALLQKARRLVRPSANPSLSVRRITSTTDLLGRDILFTLNFGEYNRFLPFLRQLCDLYPARVACAMLYYSDANCEIVRNELSIPVLNGPSYVAGDNPLHAADFSKPFDRVKGLSARQDGLSSVYGLDFHFNWYLFKRWPGLQNAFLFWESLFRKLKPRYVIGSSLYDGETQLPLLAAKRQGIKTISIPHSGVTLHDNLICSDLILYNYPIQKLFWQDAGVASDRLKPCRNLLAENQYRASGVRQSEADDRKNILIVTEPLTKSTRLLEVGIGQHINDQRILESIPKELLNAFSVTIKLYPLGDTDEFVRAIAAIDSKATVINNGDLIVLLEKADLVIAIDCIGSVLIHILNYTKPFIYYSPEEDKSAGRLKVRNIYKRLIEGSELVRTENEIWAKAKQFFEDPVKQQQMLERVKKAKDAYTSYDSFPTIREYVA